VKSINPENSSFDYSPCVHSNGNVVCDQVPLEEVQKVFKRTPFPRLLSVKLVLQPEVFSESVIPENVFGTKQILDILIEYPLDSYYDNKLQVDVNAFRSTKSYTTNFTINNIHCTLLDLSFLSGFDKLTKLHFNNIYKIQHCLPSLPPLFRLITLYISHCSGMNELYNFPVLTNGLKDARFANDDISKFHSNKIINDETLDRIIDWLLLSSANTLEEMSVIYMNQLTQVPIKISTFKALRKLWLYDNSISTIKSGAFSFSVPVSLLSIHRNGIREIEPGAFQGKHDINIKPTNKEFLIIAYSSISAFKYFRRFQGRRGLRLQQ